MFRRKGPSDVEAAKENELKIALTQELSSALKSLQKEGVDLEGTAVYSTDTANSVCNCLEAVFLHGLKANQLKKFANYMGLGQDAISSPRLNFWNLAVKFTHSEVVSQLKHLGQITTEIGLCRAWVRVAMNDGLIESYVDAMVADKKTLSYYYHTTAYLRDPEQPEILKTYIHGLMAFEFKLSYNASVLNEWSYAPLLLAGIIDSNDAPPPVIKPPVSQAKTSQSSSQPGSSSEKKSRRRSKNPMEQPKFGEPSKDTFYVSSSDFTSKDVEEFKKLAANTSSMPHSECSGSSHVSCPDPPCLNLSPAQYLDNKYADVRSAESAKSTDTENESTAEVTSSSVNTEVNAVGNQGEPVTHVQYKGYTFPAITKSTSDDVLKDLYTTDIAGNTNTDDVQVFDAEDDMMDGVKPREDEESWEKFYKSPDRKQQGTRNLQRMESLNTDLREKAILNNFEEEGEKDVTVSERPALPSNGQHEQQITSVADSAKVWLNESVPSEKGDKTCDEQTSVKSVSEVSSVIEDSAIDSDLMDKILDRAKAEVRSSSSEILTKENLQRLEQELASQPSFVTERHSGSDVESNDGQIAYNRRKSKPKNKLRKEKQKVSADKLKPQLSPPSKQPVTAELSDAVADKVETIRTLENPKYLSKHRLSMPDVSSLPHRNLNEPRQSMPNIAEQEAGQSVGDTAEFLRAIYDGCPIDDAVPEDDVMGEEEERDREQMLSKDPRQSIGNNLMLSGRGWSSSFDESTDNVEPLTGPRVTQHVPINRPKSESFGTLLQNYTPGSSLTARSIDDVLSNLPKHDTASPVSQSPTGEMVDGLMEGFEVVPISDPQDEDNSERLIYLSEIANERGLDSQNFQCQGCSRALGLIFGKPRVCKFDGGYYCFECHENEEYYIPAIIVHNWDFRKHKVCKRNLEFLKNHEESAYIDVEKVNPRLYDHVQEIQEVKTLRTQLVYLKSYLHTCKQSTAEDLRRLVWPREYLYDNVDLYSLTDLLQVPSGVLAASVRKVIKFAMKHVYSCRLCSQKGFICELCHNPKVIYAFEIDTTYRCPTCKTVFHKECKTDNRPCPKCQRRLVRQAQHNIPVTMPPSDYDFHVA